MGRGESEEATGYPAGCPERRRAVNTPAAAPYQIDYYYYGPNPPWIIFVLVHSFLLLPVALGRIFLLVVTFIVYLYSLIIDLLSICYFSSSLFIGVFFFIALWLQTSLVCPSGCCVLCGQTLVETQQEQRKKGISQHRPQCLER